MLKICITFYKLSTAYLVDKRQRFKYFISQATSARLKFSSSSAEKSCAGNFKMDDYFFNMRVTMFSAEWSDGFWIVCKLI